MKMSSYNGSTSSQNSTNNMSPTTINKNKSDSKWVNSNENNNSKLYINGNVNKVEKTTKPVVDPFAAVQPQPSFANFDNAPIFSATPPVPIPGTGSLLAPQLSSSPVVPTEDRYAALKDLDYLMKSQNASASSVNSQHEIPPPTTQLSSSDPWGTNGLNSPVVNGIWSSPPVVVRPKETVNGFGSNPFADDGWGMENGNQINNGEASKNPFKNTKFFSDWPGSNGTSEITSSQSFGNFSWVTNNHNSHPNPFTVGSFGGTPTTNPSYHASNPFL